MFEPTLAVTSVPKQIIYCKIPYASNFHNSQIQRFYVWFLNFFLQIDLLLIFTDNRTIESLFKY